MSRATLLVEKFGPPTLALGLLAGLYATSLYNFNLFHSLAELFSVVVAASVFALAWNSRRFATSGALLFLGIAMLFVGGLDLFHTLAYKGMGVFPGDDADLPTQLWIAARYLQAFSFLAAPLFLRRKPRPFLTLVLFAGLTALLLASIFAWNIFPVCFVDGDGVTPFKRISEYVIAGLHLAAAWLLLRTNRAAMDPRVVRLLAAAMLVGAVTELTFSDYATVFGLPNLVGHYLKIITFYLIYKAIVETGLNEPYGVLFRDLARSEADLQRRSVELQQEVLERRRAEAALERYSAALARSNRDLEEFAYVASHDLQEPLRKIRTFGQRLQTQLDGGLGPEGQDYLARMLNAAERMQKLMEDLLEYSRVGTKGQPFALVDLRKVAEEVVTDLEARLEETGGRVLLRDLPVVEADPPQMRQLLQNLIGNALKFHRPGVPPDVEVYLGTPPGGGCDLEMPDGCITLVVEDNGIGFDEIYLDRIFKPFQRLHGRSEYRGSGIGLAICQKIVERHAGSITACSTPGEGSRFLVTLPRRRPQTA